MSVAELLCNIGKPVISHLRHYLLGNDEQLVLWIFSEIIEKWPREYVIQLKNELEKLAVSTETFEYVHSEAKRILEEHELL